MPNVTCDGFQNKIPLKDLSYTGEIIINKKIKRKIRILP